jgi:DNA-binding GntR family transcriptional regulator
MTSNARLATLPKRQAARPTGRARVTIAPPGPRSLRDQAYEAIKYRIITCAYKPGAYLNESQLFDELGFGRTPIHQAVTQLQLQGLLAVIPRKGIIVTPVSLSEILHVAEARLVNEMECVRLASERITTSELDELDSILERSNQARAEHDIEKLMLVDRDFHIALARAARNPVLADILRVLHERSLRVWFISLNNPEHLQAVHAEHEAIVAALRSRDPTAAVAAMRSHIMSYRANITRSI